MTSSGPRPRIAFLGTPDVAIPTLDRLLEVADVAVVVTQPDRPVGRSKTPRPPPVKVRALELALPVAQPERSVETANLLESAGPLDAAVLVAFGQLIRPSALAVPRIGILNVHFSLLPRWRGAAPVQRAIIEGDERLGVTVIVLDEGLDTGPIVASHSTMLGRHETGGAVLDRLAHVGADLLGSVLASFVEGAIPAVDQPPGATVAPKLTPEDRWIDWTQPATSCVRRIRALAPKPGATTLFEGQAFKILSATDEPGEAEPGTIGADGLVGTSDGLVRLAMVQPPGKREMAAADWLRGQRAGNMHFGG